MFKQNIGSNIKFLYIVDFWDIFKETQIRLED